MTPTEIQLAYRSRKRAAGKCMYGGCNRRTTRSFCQKHLDQRAGMNQLAKLRKKTTEQLVDLSAWHATAMRRIGQILKERAGT